MFKNFKLLASCLVLITIFNTVKAEIVYTNGPMHHACMTVVCGLHNLKARTTQSLQRFFNPDAYFIQESNWLLTDIQNDYGQMIKAMDDKGADALIAFIYDNRSGRNTYCASSADQYLSELAKLLQYQPHKTSTTITSCREQLLKAQKDLNFLTCWFTHSRLSLYKTAIEIMESYHDRKLWYATDFSTAKLKFKKCRCCLGIAKCALSIFVESINKNQAELQERIDIFLQDNPAQIIPAYVAWVVDGLNNLKQIVINDPDYPADKQAYEQSQATDTWL